MLLSIIIVALFFNSLSCVPISGHQKKIDNSEPIVFFDELNKHDYSEYMNGVLKELQTDKEFLKQIEKNQGSTLEQYSENLSSASDQARNKLDEIKRREVARLNKLEKELEKKYSNDNESFEQTPSHIASANNPRFTKEDLQALIAKVTHDITMVDRATEKQYQRRRIQKRINERRQIMKTSDPEERKKLRAKFAEKRIKRLKHSRIHEPGSQQQFTEVWSNKDRLDPQTFSSKTFFKLHDLNQDDHWDIAEIEALVQSDVEKVSGADTENGDNDERFHETMKMRQHIIEKMDTNKDQMISLEEFLQFEKTANFKKDEEWKTSEEQESRVNSEEDLGLFADEISTIFEENVVQMDTKPLQGGATKL